MPRGFAGWVFCIDLLSCLSFKPQAILRILFFYFYTQDDSKVGILALLTSQTLKPSRLALFLIGARLDAGNACFKFWASASLKYPTFEITWV